MTITQNRLEQLRGQENHRWDLFCGISCAGTGVEQAFEMLRLDGYSLGINHMPNVIDTSRLNHPEHEFMCKAIQDVNPKAAFAGRKARFGWGSPSCFTADVLILTARGLVPISEVVTGDLVWTHKNRWRKVTDTSTVWSPTRVLNGYGHYGLRTTDEHPFYSKRVTKRYPTFKTPEGKKRRPGPIRELVENPFWERADSMVGKLWATPLSITVSDMPAVDGIQWDCALFHFIGCFLGDGHVSGGQIIISVGAAEEAEFEARFLKHPLKRADGSLIMHTKTYRDSVVKFCFGHAELCRWLSQFGDDCYNKTLPVWILGIQKDWKEALLEGYLATDGNLDIRHTCTGAESNRQSVGSASKRLALSFKLLATSLGHAVSWIHIPGGWTTEIEGRTVNCSDMWKISWTTNLRTKTFYTDSRHMFLPVKGSETSYSALVYNMSVEEDESYLADGIVVHNCKTHSSAKGGVPVNKEDRCGPEEILDWMTETNVDHVIVENVTEFQKYTYLVPMRDKSGKFVFQYKVGKKTKTTTAVPIEQGNQSFEVWCKALSSLGYEVALVQDKTRLGELFREWLDAARELGYEADYRCLVAADYGDATTRKRLFVQFARKDAGVKVVWPTPTHCKPDDNGIVPPGMKRWRTARDIIDTTNLGKSIVGRKKPLAPKTLRRILIGFEKFVIYPLLNCAKPAEYFVTRQQGQSTAESVDAPVSTVMTGVKHALASAFILPQQRGGAQVKSVDTPVSPVTCKGAESLCVVKYKGTSTVESLDQPLTTIQAQSRHHGVMTTNILKYYGQGTAVSADNPLDTVTAKSRFGLQTTFVSTIDNRSNVDGTTSGDAPISTITTKQRHAAVSCVVQTSYTGSDQSRVRSLDQPTRPVAGHRGNEAVVTYKVPEINGGGEVVLELNCLAPGGKGYPVLHVGDQAFEIDILFRMFTVRELAAAQGLPDDYKFSGNQTEAIAGIGNGVPVNLVRALTAAAVSQQSDIIQQLERAA